MNLNKLCRFSNLEQPKMEVKNKDQMKLMFIIHKNYCCCCSCCCFSIVVKSLLPSNTKVLVNKQLALKKLHDFPKLMDVGNYKQIILAKMKLQQDHIIAMNA